MAKLKLNPNPTFTAKVPIPVPGQAPANVEFTFKHRTRTQTLDWFENKANCGDVDLIMDCVASWELDDEFNAENVGRLCDAYAGAGAAVVDVYLLRAAVRAIYSDAPDVPPQAELAMYGLTVEDFPEQSVEVEIWPDNVPATNTFIAMGTQWRMGPAGATGMDYGPLPGVMDMLGIDLPERTDTFECLRVMEIAALKIIEQERDKNG